jgi:hypothetical protein
MITIDILFKFIISMIAAIVVIYIFLNMKTQIINFFIENKIIKSYYEIRIFQIDEIDEKFIKTISEVCLEDANETKKFVCCYLRASNRFNLKINSYSDEYKGKTYLVDFSNFDPSKNNSLVLVERVNANVDYVIKLIN